jgi:hypothetical protein
MSNRLARKMVISKQKGKYYMRMTLYLQKDAGWNWIAVHPTIGWNGSGAPWQQYCGNLQIGELPQ